MNSEYRDLLIKNGIFGRADCCRVEDDYFVREAYENAMMAGGIDIDEVKQLSEYERGVRTNIACMGKLEELRTERKDRKLANELKEIEMKDDTKKNSELDFMDLRSTNIIRVDGVSISFSKYVKWNKERRGVVEKSFINVEISGEKKSIKLLIGGKDSNVWCAVKNATEKTAPKQIELAL